MEKDEAPVHRQTFGPVSADLSVTAVQLQQFENSLWLPDNLQGSVKTPDLQQGTQNYEQVPAAGQYNPRNSVRLQDASLLSLGQMMTVQLQNY